ncbi:carboxymuconolactone decarboxylase family protein [Chryseobacterium paridis]|uniref:Carboxymuconolactone decarboxylase family protein n=1 Tax=Chryseobacterium paridis TaxID=2800328 RepID=A0ABS1FWB3_9FLAO|nr:carboxymuconolactone decarboxylase family protein [Chryseobacterium paridis]MBK1896712.1 carboxymuconolactone decarboxylase family protein [Chryseobacterium paridis]
MSTRIKIDQIEPGGYEAIVGLEKFIETFPLSQIHKGLIKIRASQINGCAFCLDKHTKEAYLEGETEQRVYALNAWRDTPFFTHEERVILALTEEVTLIGNHVKDETYQEALEALGESYLAQTILAIITINAWNRIGITTQMVPA